jgi:nucleoside-diphosphate-sugar epimerase
MKILVTGPNGFLGRCVVHSLLAQGLNDLRLVVRSPSAAMADAIAREFPQARVEWLIGDLTDRAFAEQAAMDAELVYHLAAGMRGNGPDVIFNTVVGTDNLFAALQRQTTVRRVVLVSSFAVYGLRNVGWNHRLTETSPLEEHPELREPYTYSKLKQEQLLQKSHLPAVIVRPGVIYGEGGPHLSARVGLRVGGLFLSLGGSAWLPLTYVENCADAVVLAGLKEGVENQIFNVVDDELLRASQYRRRYSRAVSKLRSIVIPYPFLLALGWGLLKYHRWSNGQLPAVLTPYKIQAAWKHCRFDNSKTKQLLGWQPRIGLEEALQRTFQAARIQPQT